MTQADKRVTQAEKLEAKARELRQAAQAEHLADFPQVGERISYQIRPNLQYYYHFREGIAEATVSYPFPSLNEMSVEFDEWEKCYKCNQRTHKKRDRINFSQILERHLERKGTS